MASSGVVRARLVSASDDLATLEIVEVLAGDGTLPESGTISVTLDAALRRGEAEDGLWIIGPGDPPEALSTPSTTDEEGILRLLDGKRRLPEPPTEDEIRALAAEADAVVFGRIEATSRTEATVAVEVVIDGEPGSQPLDVRRAADLPWSFPLGAPSYGVLFLAHDGDSWVAIDDQRPSAYLVSTVRAALD